MHKLQNLILLLILKIVCTTFVQTLPSTTLDQQSPNSNTSIKIVLGSTSMLVRTVPEGVEVQLICQMPHPIWYKNNHELYASNPLNLAHVRSIDAGLYSCFTKEPLHGLIGSNLTLNVNTSLQSSVKSNITDLAKIEDEHQLIGPGAAEKTVLTRHERSDFSNKAHNVINKGNAPTFEEKMPTHLSINLGLPVELSCFVTGGPTPNITWYFNDTLLQNNTNEWFLVINELKLKDSGNYKCRGCNVWGCTEQQTQLTVQDTKPYISEKSLQNQTVKVGENARFECHVESELTPIIIWEKSKVNIYKPELKAAVPKKIIQHSIGERDLYFPHVQQDDAGLYTCHALTHWGKANKSAYLTVLMQETTTTPLATITTSYELSTTTSKPNVTKCYKEHDDNNISRNAESTVESPPAVELAIEKLCDFNNSAQNVTATGYAPTFTQKMPSQVSERVGGRVHLNCFVKDSSKSNITWYLNDKQVNKNNGFYFSRSYLIIDDLKFESSGDYKCLACNKIGCAEQQTQLRVKKNTKPTIKEKTPQNQTVVVNGNATFECSAVSDLQLHFKWTRNKCSPMLAKPDLRNLPDGDNTDIRTNPKEPHILRLENVTHKDAGWYTCTVANVVGSSSASAYLKVIDKAQSRYNSVWVNVAGMLVLIFFVNGAIFILYVLRKVKHEKNLIKNRIETVHQWTKKVIVYNLPSSDDSADKLQLPVIKIEKQRTTVEATGSMDQEIAFNEYEFRLDSNWEIARNRVVLGAPLGEGAFGRVVMAEVSGLPSTATVNNSSSIVAVKMVKEEHSDEDMAGLVLEMEVMKLIGKHINIINLIGCCSQNGPLWVIVEFARHGNLKDFLKKNRPLYVNLKSPLTEKSLISFALQAARGMEYLASRKVSSI